MRATVWEITSPDPQDELVAYRWMIEHQQVVVVSKIAFTSSSQCKKSLRHSAWRYFKYQLKADKVRAKTRTNMDFIV